MPAGNPGFYRFLPPDDVQTVYVGKDGDDANDGWASYKAKLTIQAAIAAAVSYGAAIATPFVVQILDDGTYTENLALAQYVNVLGPAASLTGTIVAANHTQVWLRTQNVSAGIGYTLNIGGAGDVFLTLSTLNCSGAAQGILVNSATDQLFLEIGRMLIENGVGIEDRGSITGKIERFTVTGTSTAISRPANAQYTHLQIGFFGDIEPAGAGTLINVQAGTLDLNVAQMYTRQLAGGIAWTLGAAGSLRGRIEALTFTGTPTRVVTATSGFSLEIGNFGYPNGNATTVVTGGSPYTVLDTDGMVLLDTTAGAVNAVLPAAANRQRQQYEVKWIAGGNPATVTVTGGGTIDGAVTSTFVVLRDSILVESDGVEWKVIASGNATAPDENQIIYVGKNGSNANNGRSITRAKESISAAIAAAAAMAPAPGTDNRFVVKVLDDGLYTDNIVLVPYVDVHAPNATLAGTIVGAPETRVMLGAQRVITGTTGYLRAEAGQSTYECGDLTLAGTALGVVVTHTDAEVWYRGRLITVAAGQGFGNGATDAGKLHLDVMVINLSGAGTAIGRAGAGTTWAIVKSIANSGAGAGSAVILAGVGNPVINLDCQDVNATVAWNLAANTTLCGRVDRLSSGTRTVAATATITLEIGNYGHPNGAWRTIDNAATGYAILDTDGQILLDTTAGVVNVVLPVAANRQKQRFEIKWNLGAGAASADVAGGGTIDGALTYNFAALKNAITVESDGAEWKIV